SLKCLGHSPASMLSSYNLTVDFPAHIFISQIFLEKIFSF
ncbi:hypothetical protein X975_09136, partial [Stegodyphus mimosarum]